MVKRDLLSKLLDTIESGFDEVNAAYYQNSGSNIDEDNDMSAYNLSKRLFTYGLFCGRILNLTSVFFFKIK